MSATLDRPDGFAVDPSKKPTNILVVGHCRNSFSDRALAVAAELGRRLDAQLHVVHAIAVDDYPVDSDAADWEEEGEQALAEERHHVEAALTNTGLRWTYECCRGDPAKVLATAADERDALMIVVGTRGEGLRVALSRLIEPSVSHGLIEYQPRPVLVVPTQEPASSDPNPTASE